MRSAARQASDATSSSAAAATASAPSACTPAGAIHGSQRSVVCSSHHSISEGVCIAPLAVSETGGVWLRVAVKMVPRESRAGSILVAHAYTCFNPGERALFISTNS